MITSQLHKNKDSLIDSVNPEILGKNEYETNYQHRNIFVAYGFLGACGFIYSMTRDPAEYLRFDMTVFMIWILYAGIFLLVDHFVSMEKKYYKFILLGWLFGAILFNNTSATDFVWIMYAAPIAMSCRYHSERLVVGTSIVAQLVLILNAWCLAYIQPIFGYARASSVVLPKGITLVGDGIHSTNEQVADLLMSGAISRLDYFRNIYWEHVFFFALELFCISMLCVLITKQEIRNLRRQSEYLEEKRQMDVELTESRNRIMISQIQPHFVFNVLNSVYELCEEDAREAQDMLLAFSDYLRYDIDMLVKDEEIPFTEELDLVDNYLKLEKMRFGERLRVKMDIAYTDFKILPFSLEPLVENAVKHGICRERKGGTVSIITREMEESIYIRIEDDGVGFDTKQQSDDKNHVGLSIVRTRLVQQMNASVEVESEIGKGTSITILLPKKASGEEKEQQRKGVR